MKRIIYAGGELISTDELVDALIDYATRLGQRGFTDSLTVPSVSPSGTVGRSTVLIGPASEILAEPAEQEEIELDDAAVIADLIARRRALDGSRATPSDMIGPDSGESDLDFEPSGLEGEG